MNDHQRKIMAYLMQHENAGVKELSLHLRVSDATTRRQLALMEQMGVIVRSHGGARLTTPITYEFPYEQRAAHANEAKRVIAAKAISLISSNQVIGLSGGTTCTELARQLRTLDSITVVTNAINIALEIRSQGNRRTMLTGGLLNQNSYELVGNQVAQSLQNVHLDLTFLGATGISQEFGFSMTDEPEANAGRAFIQASDRVVVIADHTKIGKSTFARLCSLTEVDLLITDDQIEAAQLKSLESAGLKVLIAQNPSD
jgi:DeoR/GlpR family transcriptional regulator of sugar metabolism